MDGVIRIKARNDPFLANLHDNSVFCDCQIRYCKQLLNMVGVALGGQPNVYPGMICLGKTVHELN